MVAIPCIGSPEIRSKAVISEVWWQITMGQVAAYLAGECVEGKRCRWHDAKIWTKCFNAVGIGFVLQQTAQILIGHRGVILLDVDANNKIFACKFNQSIRTQRPFSVAIFPHSHCESEVGHFQHQSIAQYRYVFQRTTFFLVIHMRMQRPAQSDNFFILYLLKF